MIFKGNRKATPIGLVTFSLGKDYCFFYLEASSLLEGTLYLKVSFLLYQGFKANLSLLRRPGEKTYTQLSVVCW